MTTTSLFVELIVIGVMGGTWLLLTLMAFADPKSLESIKGMATNEVLWVPALAFCYVLGTALDIVIDRPFFHYWEFRIRATQVAAVLGIPKSDKRRQVSVWKVMPHVWHPVRTFFWHTSTDSTGHEITGYLRHRIRIVRAGAVNSLLIGIAGYIYLVRQMPDVSHPFFSVVIGVVVFGLGIYAWRTMTVGYTRGVLRCYQKYDEHPITWDKIEALSRKEGTAHGTVVQGSNPQKRSP